MIGHEWHGDAFPSPWQAEMRWSLLRAPLSAPHCCSIVLDIRPMAAGSNPTCGGFAFLASRNRYRQVDCLKADRTGG